MGKKCCNNARKLLYQTPPANGFMPQPVSKARGNKTRCSMFLLQYNQDRNLVKKLINQTIQKPFSMQQERYLKHTHKNVLSHTTSFLMSVVSLLLFRGCYRQRTLIRGIMVNRIDSASFRRFRRERN